MARDGTPGGSGTDAQQAAQLALLIDSVTDYAIFLLDPEGHVRTWNRGAERIKGYTAAEAVGQNLSLSSTPEDRERNNAQQLLEIAVREGRYEEEGWRVRKDGTQFWASVTITSLRDDDGVLTGFAKITRDLTARREAEEAQREAAEELLLVNEELDRFASVAAHDLNDPLRTISGFAELLARTDLPPTEAEYAGHILATTDRMTRLVTNLLEFARSAQPGEGAAPVALAEVTDRVLAGLQASIGERDAVIEVGVPGDAMVCAGASELELILQNLIANALKFGDQDAPRVQIAARRDGDRWRVGVTDNGVGVAPEDQERIFLAFERAHAKLSRGGTGLGLAICERLARRFGGEIGVESEPGQGSTFWVLLPSPDATA